MKPIIDVSEHNGILQWDTIKPQIDGVIIRCGYGGNTRTQDDKQYANNVRACTDRNIPFGVYLFSYARTAAEAIDEAEHVLRLVQGWNLDLPIYYDLEYSVYVGDLDATTYTKIALAFCNRIEEAKGFVGIYANTFYWQNKLQNVDGYTRWVAQWSNAVTLDKPYKLWQYSSDGSIQGSSTRTDMNRYYGDFLTMAGTKNHFSGQTIPKPDPVLPSTTYKVGDIVSFNALYTSSSSTEKISEIAVTKGVITKVIAGAKNPYLINNGTGWVNDSVILKDSVPSTTTYKIGDRVSFNALYTSSSSTEKITNIAITSGTITNIIPGAHNPYLINGGTGWVNDSVIVKQGNESSNTTSLHIGDRVRVRQGANDYAGGTLAPFVYSTTYLVMEIQGDRIVIGNGTQITAAIQASNLYRV